ncbi:MAG: hypothetical protein KGN76_09845 [Acidobacteriota bacterium]|nr:hypothetical protein [Acidobacteriota bacterium]
MKKWMVGTMFVVASAALAAAGLAQPPMGRGMGPGMRYDKAHEVTVTGTIEDVVQRTGMGRMAGGSSGTHLMLKTETETLEVFVGPTTWLEQQKVTFTKGEAIEVTGAHTTFGQNAGLIAREIKMGGKTITLRNADGVPVWSRRGSR